MDCCTGDELLTQLLEEQLDHDQAAPIIAHVETCVSCQERLKQLTNESCHFMKWGYFGDDESTPWIDSIRLGRMPSRGFEPDTEIGVGSPFSRDRRRGWISHHRRLRVPRQARTRRHGRCLQGAPAPTEPHGRRENASS